MIKIAFQGRPGAYSEKASHQLFGDTIALLPCDFFEDVYIAVQKGHADFGVLPIENSTAGPIHENYDLLKEYGMPIVAETKVPINHALMACAPTPIAQLTQVHSHPQALAQCSHFFQQNPHIRKVSAFDTAGSAEHLSKAQTPHVAAIASEQAAERYGLHIIARNLENTPGVNVTRFFCIAKQAHHHTQANPTSQASQAIQATFAHRTPNKTSLVFTPTQEHSGVLYQALGCFATRNINLLRIESRPRKGKPWQYEFYLDLDGVPSQPPIAQALQELHKLGDNVLILGEYAAAE
jgi:prephenate dehydratase